jgi:NAD(P)-dependent dehydrogenase (short-subunit alcohol dehydrogenase family)
MLGEAGATVYCTGRSSRSQPNTSAHVHAGRPETIEETASMVDAAGGTGLPVRVDHGVEHEVEALFARVAREQRRLDVLVNVITGAPVTSWGRLWKQDVAAGRALVDSWVWPHVTTCRHALPLMVRARGGLVVEIVEQASIGYHGSYYFDLFEIALKRLAYAIAEEGAAAGISGVAITPGFLRTEAILDGFGATEDTWREAAETNEEARRWGFADSESPCFVGRAVAAIAADPDRARLSGGIFTSWDLSQRYGFTDLDGTQPNIWPAVAKQTAAPVGRPAPAVEWQVAPRPRGPQRAKRTVTAGRNS